MMNGSTWRWTLWSTRLLGSKPYSWSAGFTSQAMRHFWSDASKRVIFPAPLLDARMFAQVVSTSAPSGVTRPSPVTTTRRIVHSIRSNANGLPRDGKPFVPPLFRRKGEAANWLRSALVLVDKVDRVLDGRDLLGSIVGDFDTEFLFERHHQFDDVEAVGSEIVDEARFFGDLVGIDTQMFDDDLLHTIGGLAHGGLSFLLSLKLA